METKNVPIIELKPYPNNPRKGNVDLIAESLSSYGQYKPITVNRKDNTVLAGNHTLEAATKLGWAEIAVTYVDVDEITAAKIVAIDNKSSDTSGYDTQKLLDLLDEMPDLKATGYSQDDIDSLMALLDEESTPDLGHSIHAAPRVGETGLSNTNITTSLDEQVERYQNMTTRTILLVYENPVFVWVTDKLQTYRDQHGLVSNADALVKLLEDLNGEKAPQ